MKKLEFEEKEFCDMERFFTWGLVKNDESCSGRVTNYFDFCEERMEDHDEEFGRLSWEKF